MKGREKIHSFASLSLLFAPKGRGTIPERGFIDLELSLERIINKCSASTLPFPRSTGGFILMFMLISLSSTLFAQTDSSTVEDHNTTDTVQKSKSNNEGLEAQVDYSAEDSMIYDRQERAIRLYGKASVQYKNISLKAARIRFSFEDRTVLAYGVEDSSGNVKGRPVMKEGKKTFDAARIRYNFKTKKGVIQEVHTQEGNGDLYSERTKKHPNGEIHVKNGKYTTCSLQEYYIRFNKAVVIPGDKIVSGPANLVLGGIPTPLLLPFGYYPETEGGTSGIVLPKIGRSRELGFSLEEGGYYWRFEPYLDTRITGDIFSKGSWRVENLTRYKKRYRFNGRFNIDYKRIKRGDPLLPNYRETREFFVKWRHRQDPKARPNSNFNANVNIGTQDNFRNSFRSSRENYTKNVFQSNIDYSKNWANSPLSLNSSLRHSQNSRTGNMQLTLPDISLNMNRVYPFQGIGNEGTAERAWYEKISVNYTGNLRNRINTSSQELRLDNLDPILKDRMRYGMQHNINARTSLKPGVVSVTPRIGITDRWYLRTEKLRYNDELKRTDTVRSGGFQNAPDGQAGVDLTTKLYGMYQFLGERQTTIRHVLTPNIGFNYRPSTYQKPRTDWDGDGSQESYNPYRRTVFGGPNTRSSGNIRFSLINNFEGKYRAIEDSSTKTKKFKLLDNLSFSGSYDMMADSLNWSPIRISGRTTILENFNIRFQTTMDPYAADATGRRIDALHYDREGELLRWKRSSLNIGGDLKSKESSRAEPKGISEETMAYIRQHPNAYVDFSIPWNLGFNYNLRAQRNYREGEPSVDIDETIDLNGNFRVTKKWKVEFRSGYDPDEGELTYTEINIYRDLDCWEMSFNWVPFGRRRRYSFQISLASPMLKDLKLQKKERWYDRDVRFE